MGIGCEFPSLIRCPNTITLFLGTHSGPGQANTSRAPRPAGLGAHHPATFTVGTNHRVATAPDPRTAHTARDLRQAFTPTPRATAGSTRPRAPTWPTTKVPSRPSSRAACLLPNPVPRCPGVHLCSRPLPENVGSRNPRAPKSIPTNHQEIKELSVQRGGALCTAQDAAVIVREIRGKAQGRRAFTSLFECRYQTQQSAGSQSFKRGTSEGRDTPGDRALVTRGLGSCGANQRAERRGQDAGAGGGEAGGSGGWPS